MLLKHIVTMLQYGEKKLKHLIKVWNVSLKTRIDSNDCLKEYDNDSQDKTWSKYWYVVY